jgi:hypothetical protein
LRIALAAPTGKAAARLQESIRAAKPGLGLEAERLRANSRGSVHACTACWAAGRIRCISATTAMNPLPLDVLVVDEVSMVGLALLAKTVDALPPAGAADSAGRQGSTGFGGSGVGAGRSVRRGRPVFAGIPGAIGDADRRGAAERPGVGVAAGRCHRAAAPQLSASARTAVSARWRGR